jgi:DNA-binding beta-propeller fold protein YncE
MNPVTALIYTDIDDDNQIYQRDKKWDELVDSITTTVTDEGISLAIDYATGNYVVATYSSGVISVINPNTGAVITSFTPSPSQFPYGLYVLPNGNLVSNVASGTLASTIRIHSGISSTILSSFTAPIASIDGYTCTGFTYQENTGNMIYLMRNISSGIARIYMCDGVSNTVITYIEPVFSQVTYGIDVDQSTGDLLLISSIAASKLRVKYGFSPLVDKKIIDKTTAGGASTNRALRYDKRTGNILIMEALSGIIKTYK